MNRRDFLRAAGVVSAGLTCSDRGIASPRAEARYGPWRTFELSTRVEVVKASGVTRVWVPAALIVETPFQKTLSNVFIAPGGTAKLIENKEDGLGIVAAAFPAGARPVLTLTS